jgi:hypothetical protein
VVLEVRNRRRPDTEFAATLLLSSEQAIAAAVGLAIGPWSHVTCSPDQFPGAAVGSLQLNCKKPAPELGRAMIAKLLPRISESCFPLLVRGR